MKYDIKEFPVDIIVNVVNDALVLQRKFCDGKAIPHIIIDTEKYPQINNAIKLHKDVGEGKIKFTWGMSMDKKYVLLLVDSISPVEFSYIIKFDLGKQFAVIDRILSAQMVYIQAGKQGDRLIKNFDAPKVLVEIPHTGFEVEWGKIFTKHQKDRLKKMGVKRRDRNRMVEAISSEWDKVVSAHLK